jgi:hypothetical protein
MENEFKERIEILKSRNLKPNKHHQETLRIRDEIKKKYDTKTFYEMAYKGNLMGLLNVMDAFHALEFVTRRLDKELEELKLKQRNDFF